MFNAWFLFGNNPLQVSALFCMHMWYMEFSEISEKHIKTGFSQLHSLYWCSRPATPPFPHLSRKILVHLRLLCKVGKNPVAFLRLFLRPERLNWKPTVIVRWEITLIIFLLSELQKKKFDRRGRERSMLWVGEQL